jgi:DNA-binding transcriptional regulator YhcF (GntR family)
MFETTNELIDALISQRDKKELENKIVMVVNELANEGFEINDIKNYIIKMIDDRFYITK